MLIENSPKAIVTIMKAAQINNYGGDEVIEIHNTAIPVCSDNTMLVQVYAAGINPSDWKIREGYFKKNMPIKFPATLGGDFSGVVTEVGEGVSAFKKGDDVYGQASFLKNGSGSFAEFVKTETGTVNHKPLNISYLQAAALPLAGASAWQALVEHMGISGEKKIIIHGGAGGIGSIAIQIAKYFGAYVATTVRSENMEYVRNLGADETRDSGDTRQP